MELCVGTNNQTRPRLTPLSPLIEGEEVEKRRVAIC